MKRVLTIPERVHGEEKVLLSWQSQQGNFLAVTGVSKLVTIYDRHGELKDEIILPGICTGLSWDREGDMLAIGNEKTSVIFLWDSCSMKTTLLESGLKDSISFLLWSKVSHLLAVGTAEGNLLLYNHKTSRKVPVMGKHTKKITCGCWNAENLLALGSEDRILTISNSDGDTIKQISLRLEPDDVQFSEMKTDEGSDTETISLIVGQETLFLYNLNEPDNPIELAFQPRYGSIVKYKWFGNAGYMMIGFSSGYVVIISTHFQEIGQELFQTRDHRDELTDIEISDSLKMAASAGDNNIKFHDLAKPKEIYAIVTIDDARGSLDKIKWTEDGQLLALSTAKGAVHVYLTGTG